MKIFLHCFKWSVLYGRNSSDVPCYCQHSGKRCAGIPWSSLGSRLVEDTGWYWAQVPCNWWQNDPRGDYRWRSKWLGIQAEGCAKVLSHLLPLIAGDISWAPSPAPAGQLLSSFQWGTHGQAAPAASEAHAGSEFLLLGWVSIWFWLLLQLPKDPNWLECCAPPDPVCHLIVWCPPCFFHPTLGRGKGQFSELQDYEETWNWFRKNKAVMTEEKSLSVIPQQEAPWVLFGFCTYWYLFVQPLPNISTPSSCF